MSAATVYVLIIMVGPGATPLTIEFTDAYRCTTARDNIRLSPLGPLTYVECFPK